MGQVTVGEEGSSCSISHSASAKTCMRVKDGPKVLPSISLTHLLPFLFLQIISEEVICLQATFAFSLLGASDVSMIEEQRDLYIGQGSAAQPIITGDICMKTGHPAAAFTGSYLSTQRNSRSISSNNLLCCNQYLPPSSD